MKSYRKDAEEHGAVVALNCEVIGGQVAGASYHRVIAFPAKLLMLCLMELSVFSKSSSK